MRETESASKIENSRFGIYILNDSCTNPDTTERKNAVAFTSVVGWERSRRSFFFSSSFHRLDSMEGNFSGVDLEKGFSFLSF